METESALAWMPRVPWHLEIFRETTTDLANKIVNDPHWDTDSINLRYKLNYQTITFLQDNIPFVKALPMVVNISIERLANCGTYRRMKSRGCRHWDIMGFRNR